MLGSVRKPDPWLWGAAGKHPVARDYIAIGYQNPCMTVFSSLVEKVFAKTEVPGRKRVCYRYFMKGAKKSMISCGIFRDSRDAIGREYPLLISGYGMLDGWEANWDALPMAMADALSEAEYLGSRKMGSLDEFKQGLARLGTPSLQNFRCSAEEYKDGPGIGQDGFVPLVSGDEDAVIKQISGHASRFRNHDSTPPEAVFMGGTDERQCLCVFRGPLAEGVVVRLLTYAW